MADNILMLYAFSAGRHLKCGLVSHTVSSAALDNSGVIILRRDLLFSEVAASQSPRFLFWSSSLSGY